MSGPYPPPGYQRQPEDNGWGAGRQQGQYGFPTVQYSGLSGPQGQPGWNGGEPPRPGRSIGRIVVAVVSVLVIVGGVATGIVLVSHHHQAREAAQQQTQSSGATTPAPIAPTIDTNTNAPAPTTDEDDPGVPNGSTDLTLSVGSCVTAQVTADGEQYTATGRATCGSADSDLILARTTPDMTGCADHQYLRITAPSSAVYCFTLDLKQGDCVDANYLKQSCSGAPFMVVQTEPGPGTSDSCTNADGATHWVPVGRNPVKVGCLGPPKSS